MELGGEVGSFPGMNIFENQLLRQNRKSVKWLQKMQCRHFEIIKVNFFLASKKIIIFAYNGVQKKKKFHDEKFMLKVKG